MTDSLSFKILSSDKDLTQLGSAALVQHRLTKRAMAHTLEVLARYQRIAHNLDCDVILAYATSAVRESVNGPTRDKDSREAPIVPGFTTSCSRRAQNDRAHQEGVQESEAT